MIILVDMDDVLAEFEKGIIDTLIKRYPEKKKLFDKERTSHKLTEDFPDLKEEIEEIKNSKDFTKNLVPVSKSVSSLKELSRIGHEVFICTSPLSDYENSVLEKYSWVEKNLGKEWTKRIILTKDKTLIKGDILIDDKPEVSGLKKPEWEHVLFDRAYNKKVKEKKRLNWDNWKDVIFK